MTDPADGLDVRFRAAALCLTSGPRAAGVTADAQALLHHLRYDFSDAAAVEGRVRMLLAAAKLQRLFQLPAPDAPGLVFFGGEAAPGFLDPEYAAFPAVGLAGSGLTPQRAFEACVGEGIEYLSQFAQKTEIIETATTTERCARLDAVSRRFITQVVAASGIAPEQAIGWVKFRRKPEESPEGSDAWLPADLCFRRSDGSRDFVAPMKLSTGCAAGVTEDAAASRAVLELVERDAAALWWRGGRRGRAIAPDSDPGLAAAALLEQLRRGNQARRTSLLDISTDLNIPAMIAISSRADGFGFAFGLAARLDPAEAARAAIFELCQVELAHHVVAAKRRQSGDASLNEGDRHWLRLGTLIDTRDCALLRPDGEARPVAPEGSTDAASELRIVLARLAGAGIATFQISLTRPEFQVPVVRVIAPGLQPEPCAIVGGRLAQAISETGGGAAHTGGVALL